MKSSHIDTVSRARALALFDSIELSQFKIGTTEGLQHIHTYLFGDLYPFAGILRTKDISKGGFRFASHLYLSEVLKKIESMPEDTFDRQSRNPHHPLKQH